MTKVLISDDEVVMLQVLYEELSNVGYRVTTAKNGNEASEYCTMNSYDVIILDVNMPYKSGFDILKEIRSKSSDAIVILITAYATVENAVKAIKLGADDYITKPYDNNELLDKISQHLKIKIKKSNIVLSDNEIETNLFGNNILMKKIKEKIYKIKDINTTVLITGESGTGKGVIAKEIHKTGIKSDLPFIHVDCAALPENLVESELFGFEKGSFTSAVNSKKGRFELAENGTIFLDEIGTLPLSLQSKLLNVLQEKSFYKVGGTRKIPMEARIIAATNENLEKNVKDGLFREDLYYRLNIVRIETPPLRYRKDDIPMLVSIFIKHFIQSMVKNIDEIDDQFYEALQNYDWPGNIRELENAVESAVALCDENALRVKDLPLRIIKDKNYSNESIGEISMKFPLKQQEIMAIVSALEKFDGHREKTAEYLGISRRTLQYKLKKLDFSSK